jgi:hypothetical protein
VKGISTILATILIVIIVVAMVSLTYTFATSLFGSATKPAETGIDSTTQKIDKRVSFVLDPTCSKSGSDWVISFSLRHEGATYDIATSEISAFFGNEVGTIGGWSGSKMAPGSVESLTFRNKTAVDWSKTDLFTVSAPANPVSKSVTCP